MSLRRAAWGVGLTSLLATVAAVTPPVGIAATVEHVAVAVGPVGSGLGALSWSHDIDVLAPQVFTHEATLVPSEPAGHEAVMAGDEAGMQWHSRWVASATPSTTGLAFADETIIGAQLHPAVWISRGQTQANGGGGLGGNPAAVGLAEPGSHFTVAAGVGAVPTLARAAEPTGPEDTGPELVLSQPALVPIGYADAIDDVAGRATTVTGALFVDGRISAGSGAPFASATVALDPELIRGSTLMLVFANTVSGALGLEADVDREAGALHVTAVYNQVVADAFEDPVIGAVPGTAAATFTIILVDGVLDSMAAIDPVVAVEWFGEPGATLTVDDGREVRHHALVDGTALVRATPTELAVRDGRGMLLVPCDMPLLQCLDYDVGVRFSFIAPVTPKVTASPGVTEDGRASLTQLEVDDRPVPSLGSAEIGQVTIDGTTFALHVDAAEASRIGEASMWSWASLGLASGSLTREPYLGFDGGSWGDGNGHRVETLKQGVGAVRGTQQRLVWDLGPAVVEAVLVAGPAWGDEAPLLGARLRVVATDSLPHLIVPTLALRGLTGDLAYTLPQDEASVPVPNEISMVDGEGFNTEFFTLHTASDGAWQIVADSRRSLPDGAGPLGRYAGQLELTFRNGAEGWSGAHPLAVGLPLGAGIEAHATVGLPLPTSFAELVLGVRRWPPAS